MSAPFVNRTANVQRDEYVGGFGMGGGCDWDVPTTEDNYQSFVVVDEVRVPKVEPGEYILSWRWDVEQGNVRTCQARFASAARCCSLLAVALAADSAHVLLPSKSGPRAPTSASSREGGGRGSCI